MKAFIKMIFILLGCSSFLFAQGKLSFSLSASVERAFMTNGFHSHGDEKGRDRMSTLSGFVQYDLSPRLFVRAGGGFGHAVQRIKDTESIFLDQINPVTRRVAPTSGRMDRRTRNALWHIPLEIGYRFTSPKNDQVYYMGIGGAYHLLFSVKEKQEIEYPSGDIFKYNDYVDYMVENGPSFKIFGGMESDLADNFTLAIEPYLRISSKHYRPKIFRTDKPLLYDLGITLLIRKKV